MLVRLARLLGPYCLPSSLDFASRPVYRASAPSVGDFFFGQGDVGIGQLLKRYANLLQGKQLLAAVILSCLLGVFVFVSFGWLNTA